jgi:hypothetical protein
MPRSHWSIAGRHIDVNADSNNRRTNAVDEDDLRFRGKNETKPQRSRRLVTSPQFYVW